MDEVSVMPTVQPGTEEDFDASWSDTQRLIPETSSPRPKPEHTGWMAFTVGETPIAWAVAGSLRCWWGVVPAGG